jgi:hypothetical protein
MKRPSASKVRDFKANRPGFILETTNDIIVSFGVQKGPALLCAALKNLKKVPNFGTLKSVFPQELSNHRWWLEQLLVGEADELYGYIHHASSLAYRYLRKHKNK